MKKIFIALSLIIIITITYAFFFIPKRIKVSSVTTFQSNTEGISRYLLKDSNWKKWWPGEVKIDTMGNLLFQFGEYSFQITKPRYHSFELNLSQQNKYNEALLKIITLGVDSLALQLETTITANASPINKIVNYFKARKLKLIFDEILRSLKKHTDSIEEIYGFDIRNEKVQMQHLISTSKTFSHPPTNGDIYSLIENLRKYILAQKGKEEFSPMINIETTDSSLYLLRVGLPVKEKLPELGDISSKMMVKNGNILVAEVRGDMKQVDKAIKQMEKYILDYQRSIIAIPFQLLITDRLKEPDSSKWVTKIYYPVV